MEMNNEIHFVLQGKGGVGKSFGATLIAQFLARSGKVVCCDTDPVNATFYQYKSLDVAHFDIAEKGMVVQRSFDKLMQAVLETSTAVVIDNGAASFMPLTKYLAENNIFQIFSEAGKQVYIHSVLTGGQARDDTYNGFAELISKVNSHAKVVVWENEFWGPVLYDGNPITATKLFKEADKAGKIAGIVKITDRSGSDTFTGDVKKMTELHLTLNDVLASEEFNLFEKNRLKTVVGDVFKELDKVKW